MQVVVTSREEGAVLTGWGQEGSLCGGDVPFLILLVVTYKGVLHFRKVAELNISDLHIFLYVRCS